MGQSETDPSHPGFIDSPCCFFLFNYCPIQAKGRYHAPGISNSPFFNNFDKVQKNSYLPKNVASKIGLLEKDNAPNQHIDLQF